MFCDPSGVESPAMGVGANVCDPFRVGLTTEVDRSRSQPIGSKAKGVSWRNMYYILAVLIVLTACGVPKESGEGDIGEKVWEKVTNLPDSILVSKDHMSREFRMTYDTSLFDHGAMSRLTGVWLVQYGKMYIHGALLQPGRRIVVGDSAMATMSGWGKMVYEHPFQVYLSAYGSNMYDYFIDRSGSLVVYQFDYRMEDLTIRENVESRQMTVKVEWLEPDRLRLSHESTWVELLRSDE